MKDLKEKILTLVKDTHDPAHIGAALGMPEKTVRTLILAMAREGSIRITGVGPALPP